jgi:hypothetical protein
LEGLENLNNLRKLFFNNNQVNSLEPIINLARLTHIELMENRITSLTGIDNLINLEVFKYYGNPIEYMPPNLIRRFEHMKNHQNVYEDTQNVHNHNIQQCIKISISNILNIKPCENLSLANLNEIILNDGNLTNETKRILIEYSDCADVHSLLNITFKELLLHVWNRIEQNQNANEIKAILNIEMNDSLCKCFTGRMSRLINCLNGFDELVNIQISGADQIGQIISLIREGLEDANEYTVSTHKEIVTNELRAREYSDEVINEWIAFIE